MEKNSPERSFEEGVLLCKNLVVTFAFLVVTEFFLVVTEIFLVVTEEMPLQVLDFQGGFFCYLGMQKGGLSKNALKA